MRKLVVTIGLILFASYTFGQSFRFYQSSTLEFDFSSALVKNGITGKEYSPVLRFSGFYNTEHQFHFDFTEHFGLFTGLGIHNVGLITHPNDTFQKVKQRAYGLTIPLGIKLGRMSKRRYLSIGASIDYFFNYKVKFFLLNQGKTKDNYWFTDKVTTFNPSAFVMYESQQGFYVLARYYFFNFLKPTSSLNNLSNTESIPGYSSSSQIFYLGIGVNIGNRNMHGNNVITQPKKVI